MISVIVTVYNIEQYVEQCLNSIIVQSYEDLEIIIINDGSTDASGAICDRYAEKDSRVKVIHKNHEGLVKARKDGVQLARGDYVGYVDGDDWIEKEFYERLLAYSEQYGADVVCSGRIEEYDTETKICPNHIKEGLYTDVNYEKMIGHMIFSGIFFKFGLFPTVWDKLFKREVLLDNQMQVPDEIIVGEDVACSYPCVWSARSTYISGECLYHYRQRKDSMLRQKDPRYNARVYILQEYLLRRAKESPFYEILRPQIESYIMDMVLNGALKEYEFFFSYYLCHQYVFPFADVKKGSNIVIYGAGQVGMTYYRQVNATGYCNIVGWIDSEKSENIMCQQVLPPADIRKLKYDDIVVAVLDELAATEIADGLVVFGVNREKIVWKSPLM